MYDISEFMDANRDVIPDDIVSVFTPETCRFGFVSHLFGNETKAILKRNGKSDLFLNTQQINRFTFLLGPQGCNFRISPAFNQDQTFGDHPSSTLTQDFHTRLDNLLRILVHSKPHFVQCIKPNEKESSADFDRAHVAIQIR